MTYFEYRLETYEGYLVHHFALEFGHMYSIFLLLERVILDGVILSLSLSLSLSIYIYIYLPNLKTLLSNELNILVKDSNN